MLATHCKDTLYDNDDNRKAEEHDFGYPPHGDFREYDDDDDSNNDDTEDDDIKNDDDDYSVNFYDDSNNSG